MSIMELDPPDYWLVDYPDEPDPRLPLRRVWVVAPLVHEKGHQVLLVRVNPPHRVGFKEHDFVVLEPRHYGLTLDPVRAGATRVNICTYHGQYRGQSTVTAHEMRLHWVGAVINREDWALDAQAHLDQSGGLPPWAYQEGRPDAPPERPCRWRRARP